MNQKVKKIKRYVILFLILALFALLIIKVGPKNLFTYGSVKKVRKKSIQQLKDGIKTVKNDYRKQLSSADKVATAYQRLGNRYLENKNWKPAIDTLEKAIEYGSSNARTHYLLAVAYANLGKNLSKKQYYKKALAHYNRSIELNKNNLSAMYGRAILNFYALKKDKKAIKDLENILSKDKKFYRAKFALARIYYIKKEKSKSLSVYQDLYDTLELAKESRLTKLYKDKCKENIARLTMEIRSGK